MGVRIVTGNIFTSKCQTIVNTVNCIGVMGAGLALECRLRYPEMYQKYVDLCANEQLQIGKLWLYRADERWVLNFPTKNHWKYPTKKEYLHTGLQKFVDTYESCRIDSIAFPLLGADKGGIDPMDSLEIMESYLHRLGIYIEIYRYDQQAKDNLYDSVRDWLLGHDADEVCRITKLGRNYVNKVIDAMGRPDITQLNQLSRVRGIGIRTLEKLFLTAKGHLRDIDQQPGRPLQTKFDF